MGDTKQALSSTRNVLFIARMFRGQIFTNGDWCWWLKLFFDDGSNNSNNEIAAVEVKLDAISWPERYYHRDFRGSIYRYFPNTISGAERNDFLIKRQFRIKQTPEHTNKTTANARYFQIGIFSIFCCCFVCWQQTPRHLTAVPGDVTTAGRSGSASSALAWPHTRATGSTAGVLSRDFLHQLLSWFWFFN